VEGRIDRDLVADADPVGRHLRPDRDDLAGELVPRDHRQRRRELAVEDVQVGPADPAAGNPHDDVLGARRRVGHLGDLDLARLLDDDSPHDDDLPT
jgi:hypothetical protein